MRDHVDQLFIENRTENNLF